MTSGLVITGFHRSGTSAVAQALQQAGLDLGTNLLGAEPSNPYGHFEDIDVITAHDAALENHGLTWKDPTPCPRPADTLASDLAAYVESRNAHTSNGQVWGVKDPRICLFLDEWLHADPELHVLVVIRQPGAAIDSLHRRHAQRYVDTRQVDPTDLAFWQDPDLGLQLWLHYHHQLLATLSGRTHPARTHVVNFDDRSAIEQLPRILEARWGLPFQHSEHNQLDPTLGNNTAAIEVRNTNLIIEAEALWGKLLNFQQGS